MFHSKRKGALAQSTAKSGLLIFTLLCFSLAHAQLSPQIQKGVSWLQSQVQANGSLAAETASLATSHQNHSETQSALKALATPSTILSHALSVEQNNNTEDIARTLIALSQTGQADSAAQAELLARQNMDGGFGADAGHTSNPLDTAWAMLAIKASNAPGNLTGALNYLKSVQALDGSYLAADRSDPYTSALALQALAAYSSQYALETHIQATVTYLQTQQAAAGNWSDSPFLSAQTYVALHDFIPLNPTAPAVSSYLLSRQLADGSWNGDPYITALALRALGLTGDSPANPSLSALRGKVIDAQTGLPLMGVTAILSGGVSASGLTQAEGAFEFRDLPPGDYTLKLSLTDYGAINATTATRAGQTQDMGVLRMSKQAGATTGTVQGKITDAATGQALGGATVSVNGNPGATTDATGQYQISNVPAGVITLEATAAGYTTVSGAGNLGAGDLMVFSPALAATSGSPDTSSNLQGIVTSAATGQPLAGVMITVSGSNTLDATTDSQGEYKLTGLASGAITLTATLSGYDTVAAEANVYPRNSITFSPEMYLTSSTPAGVNTAGITGIVMDAGSNAPLANTRIEANYNGISETLQSGSDGRFSLNGVTTARIELKFTHGGYQSSAISTFLAPLSVLDIGQIRLRRDKANTLLPDLTVKAASRQSAITDPQRLIVSGSVNVTLANIGTANAPAGAQVLAFQDINRNGAFDAATDVVLGQLSLPTELTTGAQVQVQIPVQGALTFRDAPIHLWVDSAQNVAELKENNNVGSTAMGAEIKPNIGTFLPVVKWEWKGGNTMSDYNQVEMTPAVAPTGADKSVSNIVFVSYKNPSYSDGVLRIISGKDGSELMTVTDPAYRLSGLSNIAVGDIDGSGNVSIIAQRSDNGLIAFSNTGMVKWTVDASLFPPAWHAGGISIADLDGNGKAEIIYGNAVLNFDGSLRWQGAGNFMGDNYFRAWADIITPYSIVADINLTGRPAVIAGASAYDVDGTLLWENQAVGDGFTAIGNFTGGVHPQIVVVNNGRVFLLDHAGSILWGPVHLPSGGHGGTPVVADMDGDGIPEIGIAGLSMYNVIGADGSFRWASPSYDGSSATGSTVFDFAGDGKARVVYGDERDLRVYDGATGDVLFSIPNKSDTSLEMAVVADVDNDSHADLVIPQSGGEDVGLRVFQDKNNSWVNTRKIWNQHSYHITNINEDGSVPRVEQNSWEAHNSYRLNARPGISATAVADLTASWIRIQDRGGAQPSTLTARIGNGGGLAVDPGVLVAYYNGKPETGGVLLGTVRTPLGLGSGEHLDINLNYPGALTGITELVIVADDDGTGKTAITDFDRANNRASLMLSAQPGSLTIQVATDQTQYGPNAAVAISATVANAGSFDGNANLRLSVETADGSVQVASLPATTLAVAKTASATLTAAWNTGTTYLGAYRVKAELLDAQNAAYAHATTPFSIGASATLIVDARITADKTAYQPTDSLKLTDRISNLTQNQMLDALTVDTTVYQPDGSVLWTQSAALSQLTPASFKELNYSINLAMAAPGAYRAALTVKNAAGTTLARNETGFTVQSTANTGSGLTGTLSVSPGEVASGNSILLTAALTNQGNADLTALPISLSIVDPASQSVLANWPYSVDMAKQKSFNASVSWNASASSKKAYAAVLAATVGGKQITLASANFTVTPVTETPVKLDIKQQLLREGRLLVLLTCKDGEGDDRKKAYSSSSKETSKHRDDDDHGHLKCDDDDDKPCIDERAGYLDTTLTSLGIEHWISGTLDDFRQAFRSGKYNTYWISGGAQKLDNDLAQEIREAVNRGDALLLEGKHDERNGLLDEIVGVTYRGKLSGRDQPITLAGPLYTPGVTAPTRGQPLKLALNGGAQHARFPGATPAIVGNAYGKGRGMIMAFDLMGLLLQTQPLTPVWQSILQASFGYLAPQASDLNAPETLSAGAYAVARTTLTNQGQAVTLDVAVLLPSGATVVSTTPLAAVAPDNRQANWALSLAVGQSATLDLALRAPQTSGGHTLTTTVNSIQNGQSKPYGSYPLALNVASALERTATTQLITDLKALSFTNSKDREARDQAVKALQSALDKTAQGKNEDAIGKLLDAVDKLRRIGSRDMSAYRLAVDRWLQEIELEWLDAKLTPRH
jgi:hypothetical protein